MMKLNPFLTNHVSLWITVHDNMRCEILSMKMVLNFIMSSLSNTLLIYCERFWVPSIIMIINCYVCPPFWLKQYCFVAWNRPQFDSPRCARHCYFFIILLLSLSTACLVCKLVNVGLCRVWLRMQDFVFVVMFDS